MPRIRFDRNELAGAFGDIGTDLPLITGMILAAHLDSASVLIMFGLMQYATGLMYGIPMAVQPLKAVAVIVITGHVASTTLFGGAFAIGVVMLVLSLTGGINLLARIVPRTVVRGLQLGLGIQLSLLALRDYVPHDGTQGYLLAAIAFTIIVLLLGNRRYPPALFAIALGIAYAAAFRLSANDLTGSLGFSLPEPRAISIADITTGFLVLAIPQIPLSLGNSILATRQIAEDLFPEKLISVRKLSLTYAAMNLVNPWLGGVPTCHGSGGIVGHYTFGARTGGSLLIYGSLYLLTGLFLADGFQRVVEVFPLPILGVLLLFEAAALMLFVRDEAHDVRGFLIVILVGLIASNVLYGYAVALAVGTALHHIENRKPKVRRGAQ